MSEGDVQASLGRRLSGIDSNGLTGLWVSDGTATGTSELRLFGYPASAVLQSANGANTVLSLSDGTTITLLGVASLPATAVV